MELDMIGTPSAAPLGRAMLIIGWREEASLPQWGIRAIKTKIDTGARTSAVHVDNVQLLPRRRVRFEVIVHPARGSRPAQRVPVETTIVRVSRVRPSHGERQERVVVRTQVRLGPVEKEIELSLVSRHGMLCRMLLGRKAVEGTFLIDPSKPSLLSRARRKRRKKVAP
jgi:hypothetical protein